MGNCAEGRKNIDTYQRGGKYYYNVYKERASVKYTETKESMREQYEAKKYKMRMQAIEKSISTAGRPTSPRKRNTSQFQAISLKFEKQFPF